MHTTESRVEEAAPLPAEGGPRPVPRAHVRLLPSRWQEQYAAAADYYVHRLPTDDVLHGFRRAAGLAAPGQGLTGWCREDSRVVFGQWLSGLARFAGSGNREAADKAWRLMDGWAETFRREPAMLVQHYPFDKLVGGLVDIAEHVESSDSLRLLSRLVDVGRQQLSRRNRPAVAWPAGPSDGDELEWYTLGENLLRAFALTGDERYREFAAEWEYGSFWGSFRTPGADRHGLHAYSHLNSVNGLALAALLGADADRLELAVAAHDWFRRTQTYATGGFGPSERTVTPDGALGRALEFRSDGFEVGCGSWAVQKLTRYLMLATGQARFGDWAELITYNGIGAAIRIGDAGWHAYYSDYRVGGGVKVPYQDTYACCSGTYGQAVTDYPTQVFLTGDDTAYVNQFLPAEGTLTVGPRKVSIRLETDYPLGEVVRLVVGQRSGGSGDFAIALRIPEWARGWDVTVNDARTEAPLSQGWAWARRTWREGDVVELRLPMRFRASAVDSVHRQRVAFMRGPVVMAFEASRHEPFPALPEQLEDALEAEPVDGRWPLRAWAGGSLQAGLKPFYGFAEYEPYRMYLDRDRLPLVV